MKMYYFIAFSLGFQTLLISSDLPVDPQMEDTYLQDEQTHDIQFEEDKNLQQERSHSFEIDPVLPS